MENDLRLPWEAVEFEHRVLNGFGHGPGRSYLVRDALGITIALFESLHIAQRMVEIVNEHGSARKIRLQNKRIRPAME